MGDVEESYAHNQGFDTAYFPLHQQVQLSLMTRDAHNATVITGWEDSMQSNAFQMDQFFKPSGLVTGIEGKKGSTAVEVDLKAGEPWTQAKYNEMNDRYQRQTLEELQRLAAEDACPSQKPNLSHDRSGSWLEVTPHGARHRPDDGT